MLGAFKDVEKKIQCVLLFWRKRNAGGTDLPSCLLLAAASPALGTSPPLSCGLALETDDHTRAQRAFLHRYRQGSELTYFKRES